MKKLSKTVLGIIIGILIAFTIDVAAEAVISSGAVSYSNTTVSAALDELFSAVDINNKIGTTDISGIGNGTITGAINQLNNNINNVETKNESNLVNLTSLTYLAYQNRFVIINSRGDDVSKLVGVTIPEEYRPNVNVIIPCYLSQISYPYNKAFGYVRISPDGTILCAKLNEYHSNNSSYITSDYEVFFSGNYYI